MAKQDAEARISPLLILAGALWAGAVIAYIEWEKTTLALILLGLGSVFAFLASKRRRSASTET